jgi:regulator of nonsense transcripts 1
VCPATSQDAPFVNIIIVKIEIERVMAEEVEDEPMNAEGDQSANDSEAEEEDNEAGESDDDAASDGSGEDAATGASFDDESVLTDEGYIDHYDEANLPPYACRYCGIHDPASVARCVESNKWFCNAVGAGGGGSHLVHHLVRSRSSQVQLHPESPLGDTVLECYNCASKNCFVLGFVPANASSVVVLLCRVCVETVPALKDMDWELSQWHPLVQDRRFLPWLVKVRRYY